MIKTLLLATSCVIGSGTGAVTKTAPVFNQHYSITKTEQDGQTTIKTNVENLSYTTYTYNNKTYSAGKFTNQQTYQNLLQIQQTNVIASAIPAKTESGQNINDFAYDLYQITKIIPYKAFTNYNIICNFSDPTKTDIEQYENPTYTIESDFYITTNSKTEQILNQTTFSQWEYNPLSIFTNNEQSTYRKAYYIKDVYEGNLNEEDGDSATVIFDSNGHIKSSINLRNQQNLNENTYFIWHTKINAIELDISSNYNQNITDYTFEITGTTPIPPIENTYEVVDIGGIMFDILTMPFTFVSRAFSLTLFPETPYALNIAGLFLSLFAALVFIFIIKKFIKK